MGRSSRSRSRRRMLSSKDTAVSSSKSGKLCEDPDGTTIYIPILTLLPSHTHIHCHCYCYHRGGRGRDSRGGPRPGRAGQAHGRLGVPAGE